MKDGYALRGLIVRGMMAERQPIRMHLRTTMRLRLGRRTGPLEEPPYRAVPASSDPERRKEPYGAL